MEYFLQNEVIEFSCCFGMNKMQKEFFNFENLVFSKFFPSFELEIEKFFELPAIRQVSQIF